MSAIPRAEGSATLWAAEIAAAHLDRTTLDRIERRRSLSRPMRRGWLIRRLLLAADVVGLGVSLAVISLIAQIVGTAHTLEAAELLLLLLSLPAWVILASLHGLYDRDEDLADRSTVDDLVGVFHVATVGIWILILGAWPIASVDWRLGTLASFWLCALVLVTTARAVARTIWRRSDAYQQNTVVVGVGDVGQLVARKILKHPEYGLDLLGFVDHDLRPRRPEVEHLPLLGPVRELPELVRQFDIERVVIAFTSEPTDDTLELIRSLNDLSVQVDIVPRLFDIFTPTVSIHTIEALPLVGVPPARLSPSSRLFKRAVDVVGASILLLATAPLLAFIAWRVRRESQGPILFRQVRLGQNMREFEMAKFRTMRADTDESEHRRYIKETMTNTVSPEANGLYKLDRSKAVTPTGHWLRRTSLDELPQLLNVLRGDMSLVGPRPCLPYETAHFEPHHFERFGVPQGMSGLWQVTARANSTFREALDMDVAYARGWSLGLDLRLLLRTPVALVRQRRATA